MSEPISFQHEQMVHLDAGSYAWVSLKTFAIDPARTDGELLGALIAHWAYHDHYAGQDVADQDHHSLHGPYRLDAIGVADLTPARPAVAQSLLQAWAEDMNDGPPSPPVQGELDGRVYAELDDAHLFHLRDLGSEAQHEWGYVVGAGGFHEYVAIRRATATLVLIVASDD